jgi:hypothetical protein
VASAKKELGNAGQLPKPRVDLLTTVDEAIKTVDAFNKNRAEMEKTVVDVETAMAKVKAGPSNMAT